MSTRASSRLSTVLKQTKPRKITKSTPRKAVDVKLKLEQDVAHVKAETVENTIDASQETLQASTVPTEQALDVARPGILQTALIHLIAVDRRFNALSHSYIPQPWLDVNLSKPVNHFKSLVLGILSQQVSGAAARSISRKFIALFADELPKSEGDIKVDVDPEVLDGPASGNAAPAQDEVENMTFPTPEMIITKDVLFLKSAGLSMRKAEYVLGLAQAFHAGQFTDEFFATAPDTEIVTRLTAVRGLGPWSAEMFLMFSLKRVDCLSYGDIGIQRGMAHWLGKDVTDKSKHHKGKFKYVSQQEMDALSDTWRPFRSIGCWFMWRVNGIIAKEEDEVSTKPETPSIKEEHIMQED